MQDSLYSIREIQEGDISKIADYWLQADKEYLLSMGADINKIPGREEWNRMLQKQIQESYPEKQSYCLIWLLNGEAIGHSNVNKIIYGNEAFIHMHIWEKGNRKSGYGESFLKLCLPVFFEKLTLQKIFCEPYALNAGPNKTLEKLGFIFIKTYRTIPGYINMEQDVNLWSLEKPAGLNQQV